MDQHALSKQLRTFADEGGVQVSSSGDVWVEVGSLRSIPTEMWGALLTSLWKRVIDADEGDAPDPDEEPGMFVDWDYVAHDLGLVGLDVVGCRHVLHRGRD